MLKFKRITAADYKLFDGMVLRKADADEMRASTGLKDTGAALKLCLQYSTEWTEVCIDMDTGKVICAFGLGRQADNGVPWMLGTNEMLNHKKVIMRYGRKVVADMLAEFPQLNNYVDHRNTTHIRWLKHMGFKFDYDRAVVLNGYRFDYFYMER